MYVSPISNQVNFSAKTTVKAPETLIKKEVADNFVKMGEKIGKPADVIDITISEIHKSKVNPEKDVFDASVITIFNNQLKAQNLTVAIDKMSPAEYVEHLFTKWANK